MMNRQQQREQLQTQSSDIPSQKENFPSTLSGNLPTRKRRFSPFDRLGDRQWKPQKGQQSKSYAD